MLLTLLRPASGTPQRAIVLIAGAWAQLPIGQEGTSKKPLVLVGGSAQQRVTTEGQPIVLVSGVMRGLLTTETLII